MENDDFLIEEERKVLDEPDEDEPVYNPKNLPLGWDGKPIPYWLYKLHGLGIEYKCEICGNYSYWGRRAFERHFNVNILLKFKYYITLIIFNIIYY